MTYIRHQQREEEDAPDGEISRGAEEERFSEGEEEVKVCELLEHDGGGEGEGGRRREGRG